MLSSRRASWLRIGRRGSHPCIAPLHMEVIQTSSCGIRAGTRYRPLTLSLNEK
ncbi:hypothetical protein BAUCODRAFT_524682 [Baudoinia panamericana UAMH 10762]|uniref:Uncharacterized protein n=1 Tax=Baudoinia panamericana (strain UAMH 10762) TaxID=717646 RepID=M2MEQ9_BAUPA|nr:uncharacterized protein BAUCODRAFT_524682 [Baudoinia panamericana UAMH 10762]EMC95061.1 hypothetical protein BAUCODRAFT_524682 [Baudoinia panamericana UAMH 10762]